MGTEVDSIELQIETSAKQANRSLTGMQSRLKKIAGTLSEIGSLAPKLSNVGGVDISGLKSSQKYLDGIVNKQKKLGSATTKLKVDTSEIKKADQGFSALMRKYKDSKLRINFEAMNEKQLDRTISKLESGLNRYKQNVFDTAEQTGSAINQGKMWEKNIRNMFQYKNSLAEAMRAKEAFNTVKLNPDLTVTRNGESYKLSDGEKVVTENKKIAESAELAAELTRKEREEIKKLTEQSKKVDSEGYILPTQKAKKNVNSDAYNYDQSATESVFGRSDIKNYNDVINKVDGQSAALKFKSLNEANVELSATAKKATEAVSQEDKAIKKLEGPYHLVEGATKEIKTFTGAIKSLGSAGKKISSEIGTLKNNFKNLGNSIKNAKDVAKKALHPFKTLKSYMSGESGSKGGMSLGKMIGSSILFSSIFGAISQIKQAVKEGSDNLVQYSSEYNKSISGMVSSLLYLKNAWAVAFAPIVNVVSPYIQKFIDMLASALNAVGQFMAALTGKGTVVQAKKAWKDYGKTLSDTGSSAKKAGSDAKKAAKDFQTYTLGIDELNIQPKTTNSSSGSDSGSGGNYTGPSPSEMFETVEVSQPMSSLADKFKEAIKNSDFTDIGRMLSDKLSSELESINWQSVYHHADNFGKDLATFLNGLITPRLFYDLGATVANSINTVFHSANAFAINFDWENLGNSIASSIKGFFENWDAGLTAETFSNFGEGLLEGMTSFIESLSDDEAWKTMGQDIADFICGIDWGGLSWDMLGLMKAMAEAIIKWPVDLAIGIAKGFVKNILGDQFTEETEKRFDEMIKPFQSILESFIGNLNPLTKTMQVVNSIVGIFKKGGDDTTETQKSVWNEIMKIFSFAPQFFYDTFTKAQKFVKQVTAVFGPWFGQKWSDIKNNFNNSKVVEYFRSGFQKAFDSVKSIWNGIGSFFKGVANKIISPIGDAVNGIISGINWVLEKLNSGTKLKKWDVPKFASGTNGVGKDTIGMVNDQPGGTYKEMIVPPNGKPFIPKGRNVVMPLEKGTKIMPANQTEALMGGMGITHYANGIGDFFGGAWEKAKDIAGTVADYVTHPDKLLQIALNKFVDISNLLSPVSDIAGGIVKTIFKSAKDFIANMFSSSGVSGNVAYNVSAGVEQWRSLAKKALELTNQYSEANLNALLMQMQHESGGNPNAINLWDSNAKAGIPSKGLMQVIDPTFRSNALPGYNTNIYDPLSNMIAAIRYTVGRYGSLNAGWTARGYKGYKSGIGRIGLTDILPKYTGGGFPEDGVFMANHEEMVGRFSNGRTAVANNDQIVDGISRGVYEAMIKAQSENTRETDLLRELIEAVKRGSRIVVDGRELVNIYDKRKNRNGYSFT